MTVDEHDWIVLGDMLRQARHSLGGNLEYQWYYFIHWLTEADRRDAARWIQDMAAGFYRRDD